MPADFPSPVVERHDRFHVVRDDLVAGGTKQIVLRAFLPELNAKHFVYVASGFGKGGAALAHACAELGYKCTLYLARTPTPPAWLEDVVVLGTKIIWTDLQPVAVLEPRAFNHASQNDAHYLPLGFDNARFQELLGRYACGLSFAPKEIWCPAVSGTTAFALEQAFPDAAMQIVSVVKNNGYKGFGTLHHAPEKFVRAAAIPPPYPAWAYSDAKVWRFAKKSGAADAVIWNTNS